MKTIRVHGFGDPSVMRLEEVASLKASAGHVVVDIKAVGINPVDTYIRAGWYGPRKFPFTPGLDAAGIVTEVGEGVRNISAGQRVFISGSVSGTYAQQALCKDSQIHRLPKAISFEKGAAVGIPYRTAYRALFQRAKSVKDQTVLVHGASGGVGVAAIQFAKTAGIKVIATAGSDAGLNLVVQQGADFATNHRDPSHFEKIMQFTDGLGVDIILEMLANVNLAEDLKILATKGCVVAIGSRGSIEIDPRDLMSREASVMGVMSNMASESEREEAFDAIQKGFDNGSLNPIVATSLPLAEAPEAHREVMGSAHHGKIVLIP